jgi:surface-anchored protein
MKKFNKVFLMVLVVVLMVLAPACKKADVDPVEPSVVEITNIVGGNASGSGVASVDADWRLVNNSNDYAYLNLMGDWGVGNGFEIEGGSGTPAAPGVSQGKSVLYHFYDKDGTYTATIQMKVTFKDGSIIYSTPKTVTFIVKGP